MNHGIDSVAEMFGVYDFYGSFETRMHFSRRVDALLDFAHFSKIGKAQLILAKLN